MKFTRITRNGTYVIDSETGEAEELGSIPYYPSIFESILHLFGKHVWTYTEPKYCVMPGCSKSREVEPTNQPKE